MNQIARLARISVLRASAFAWLAILLSMSAGLENPALSFAFGAAGFLILSASMGFYARIYHRRRRIEDTEVWIMLRPEERPAKAAARTLIVNAMKEELVEKAIWWAWLAFGCLAASAAIMVAGGI